MSFAPRGGAAAARTLIIRNIDRGTELANQAAVAETSAARRTGLLRHSSLPHGSGLWIVPCEGIHTFGMKFPIDVVFLDRKLKVLKTARNLKPWRISLCLAAHSVLELPSGTLEATATRRGDQLEFEEREATPAPQPGGGVL